MNDPESSRWTDPADLPPPIVYDPAGDAGPPFVSGELPSVVLLLVGDVDQDWAARTAIELSDAWASTGRKVVLADFHLESPVLQVELGGDGLEGVVDLFLYGASMARCTRDVPGREFKFIPTGTYTPDVEAVFRNPRWSKLIDGFKHSRATLAIFAPAGMGDLEALATRVDQALLLGMPRDPDQVASLTLGGATVHGVLVPPRGETVAAAAAMESEEMPQEETSFAEADAVSAPVEEADLPRSQQVEAEAEEVHLPPPPPRVPHPGHRIGVMLLWLLLAAAVITAIGYVVATVRPDLLPWATAPAETAQGSPAPIRAREVPRPLGEPLPYSVRVVAYGSFQEAYDRLRELRAQLPGVLYYITPEDVQGVTYYKVMAGALPSADAAAETRDVLVASGAIDAQQAAGDWSLVQELRYALLLGEMDTRGAANAAVDSLLTRQVPAYPLAVPYTDGGLRWYIYAGAFPDSAAAGTLSEQLRVVGLNPRLTPRFGSPASPEL